MATKYIKIIVKGCSLLLVVLYLSACRQKQKDPRQDAVQLAKLVCESRELTHQKFILAQQYQQLNSPNKSHSSTANTDSLRTKFDKEKGTLIKMSQAKSDSVNRLLKTLWQTKYQTTAEKKQLDDAMAAELKKQCPLSAP